MFFVVLLFTIVFGEESETFDSLESVEVVQNQAPCICNKKIDLAFICDISGSIDARETSILKGFIKDVVSYFNFAPGAPNSADVALVHFNTKATTIFSFTAQATLPVVNAAVDRLPRSGSGATSISIGIRQGTAEHGRGRADAAKVNIVITDGCHNTKSSNAKTLVDDLNLANNLFRSSYRDGVQIAVGVGVGNGGTCPAYLNQIAFGIAANNINVAGGFDKLRQLQFVDRVVRQACGAAQGGCVPPTPPPTTRKPTNKPTDRPTTPTPHPTNKPTDRPTSRPTPKPTDQPTDKPTREPTTQPPPPQDEPTNKPTSRPSVQPTNKPTDQPTFRPTDRPSDKPTTRPTDTRPPTLKPLCPCRKAVDVAFAIDFSSTLLSKAELSQTKDFITRLAKEFEISETAADFSFTHFSTAAFTNNTFTGKASAASINKAIDSLQCCEAGGDSNSPCCPKFKGSSISTATRHLADNFARNGRDGVPKVSIMITDGCQTHSFKPRTNKGSTPCFDKACLDDIDLGNQYYARGPQTHLVIGISQNCVSLLEQSTGGSSERLFKLPSYEGLADEKLVQDLANNICHFASGPTDDDEVGRCQPSKGINPTRVPFRQPPAQPNVDVPTTRNNDHYLNYKSLIANAWTRPISDIPSLPLKHTRFDPKNLIEILEQTAQVSETNANDWLVVDVLTGIDSRTGQVVWGPTETGHISSKFIGVALGHAFYIGREKPSYSELVNEQYSKAQFNIFVVNTATGKISDTKRVRAYTDNAGDTDDSVVCFTEIGSSIFVVEQDKVLMFGFYEKKGDVFVDPYFFKPGYPKAAFTQPRCSLLSPDVFAYIGQGEDKKYRLFAVDINGELPWGKTPANELPDPTLSPLSLASTFSNGTTVIGGKGEYYSISPKGVGKTIPVTGAPDSKFQAFAISQDADFAVSNGGKYLVPWNQAVPQGDEFGQAIIHEQYQVAIFFQTDNDLGSKMYDFQGRNFRKVDESWESFAFDPNDRSKTTSRYTLYADALYDLDYIDIQHYPANTFVILNGLPTPYEHFQ